MRVKTAKDIKITTKNDYQRKPWSKKPGGDNKSTCKQQECSRSLLLENNSEIDA